MTATVVDNFMGSERRFVGRTTMGTNCTKIKRRNDNNRKEELSQKRISIVKTLNVCMCALCCVCGCMCSVAELDLRQFVWHPLSSSPSLFYGYYCCHTISTSTNFDHFHINDNAIRIRTPLAFPLLRTVRFTQFYFQRRAFFLFYLSWVVCSRLECSMFLSVVRSDGK